MSSEQTTKAFKNVRDQIGFCGIWCGSCIVGNGTLRELTRRYNELITVYGLEEWGPKDFDYKELRRGLESIKNLPLCPGCLKGGGRDRCEMRSCGSNKKIAGCHECQETATCKNSEALNHMRSGAIKAGLFVNTENVDKQEIVERWSAELKAKWPCSILFATD